MVKVNLIGFKQFQDTFNKLPEKLRKETETGIREAADQFRDLAINDAPADVGFLRSQITVKKGEGLTYEVISGSKYSAPMEFGTKRNFKSIPGIDSSQFKGGPSGGNYYDFLNNILDWVKRKGIGGKYRGSITAGRVTLSKKKQDTLVQAAEAIAWHIIRFGVKPHPFFFKQIAPVRRDLFRRFRETLKTIID